MRVGNIAYVKHKFRVIDYSLEDEFMTIQVESSQDIHERLKIPIYIYNFGIFLPGVDYVTPGDHLPIDHPDYYQVINVVGSPKRVMYNGKLHQLRLDPEFDLLGIYALVDETTGEYIEKVAQKKTKTEILDSLDLLLNTVHEGNFLTGRIIHIFLRHEESGRLRFVKYLSEYTAATSMVNWTAFAVLRELESHTEYEIPCKLLSTKA